MALERAPPEWHTKLTLSGNMSQVAK